MSLKQWLKSAGALAALPAAYSASFEIGDCTVCLESFFADPPALDSVQRDWQAVTAQSDASLFLRWPWISSWLEVVVEDAPLLLIRVRRQGGLIGIAFISLLERRILGQLSRVAFLNELPLPGCDMVVEQNGIASLQGSENAAFHSMVVALGRAGLNIEEIRCRAIDERYLSQLSFAEFYPPADEEQAACWLVGKRPQAGLDCLKLNVLLEGLSKGKRWQIGRFIRLVEAEHGKLRVEVAKTEREALEFFSRLETFHTAYWQAQGMPGSFRNPRWKAFHWRLICTLLSSGQVQLLRIAAGSQEVGYLYNVGHGRTMNNIQCGFVYKADNRWRPGYASQLLAAEVAGANGYLQYDLLMGDDKYKASIARPGATLRWFSLFPRSRQAVVNRRHVLRLILEGYRRVRTNSKPNAQGDSRS